MKILNFVLKLLIVLASVIYVSSYSLVILISSSPTGLFGQANTTTEQIVGQILAVLGTAMIVTSLFIFKKINFIPFLILIAFSTLMIVIFAIIEGFAGELTQVYIIYVILLLMFYKASKMVKK